MTPLVAYLLLFVAVGIGFILIHLLAGKVIRPNKPDPAKKTIYECGEPTIGSAWIQFDLRFYVVALLFVIFDVEVAFFFPWAEVFGKANSIAAAGKLSGIERSEQTLDRAMPLLSAEKRMQHATVADHLRQLEEMKQQGLLDPVPTDTKEQIQAKGDRMSELIHLRDLVSKTQDQASGLAWMALLEIAVFFGVLLVGFAYLWQRGDLAWVRSLAAERSGGETLTPPAPVRQPAPEPLAGAHS